MCVCLLFFVFVCVCVFFFFGGGGGGEAVLSIFGFAVPGLLRYLESLYLEARNGSFRADA